MYVYKDMYFTKCTLFTADLRTVYKTNRTRSKSFEILEKQNFGGKCFKLKYDYDNSKSIWIFPFIKIVTFEIFRYTIRIYLDILKANAKWLFSFTRVNLFICLHSLSNLIYYTNINLTNEITLRHSSCLCWKQWKFIRI